MDRRFYLDLAAQGRRLPIGAHLVLCEHPDHEAIALDGPRLGQVIVDAAQRYDTPLALPLMDLTIEKAQMLALLDVPADQADAYHFDRPPGTDAIERVRAGLPRATPVPRLKATLEALTHVARHSPCVPVGMAIGPFSLMTKLLADPITPVFMSASGVSAEDEPEVALVEESLELAVTVIEHSLRMQVQAGVRAVCLCEPAANRVFISPNQMDAGSDVFERLVMAPNRRLRALLRELDADLILHDCGELTDAMVSRLVTLEPAILSLGSSRKLWEDARLVPPTTVLYGNLPTKRFYSDAELPIEEVRRLARELIGHMRTTKHPFILGSECDVLSVPEHAGTISAKVGAMLEA